MDHVEDLELDRIADARVAAGQEGCRSAVSRECVSALRLKARVAADV